MSVNKNIVIKNSSQISYASRPDVLAYLASNRPITGSYTNYKTATFSRGWYQAPADMTQNSVEEFMFFINGSEVERPAITNFQNLGGSSVLELDVDILQYSLESNDTIIAIGKFA